MKNGLPRVIIDVRQAVRCYFLIKVSFPLCCPEKPNERKWAPLKAFEFR